MVQAFAAGLPALIIEASNILICVGWASVGITVKHLLTPMVAGSAAALAIAAMLLIVAEFVTRPWSRRA